MKVYEVHHSTTYLFVPQRINSSLVGWKVMQLFDIGGSKELLFVGPTVKVPMLHSLKGQQQHKGEEQHLVLPNPFDWYFTKAP